MSPWHNNCCREFPWRYQRPFNGLVIVLGAIKWLQESFLVACHYDALRHIVPSVNGPVDFCVSHFQRLSRRDIAPSVNAPLSFRHNFPVSLRTKGFLPLTRRVKHRCNYVKTNWCKIVKKTLSVYKTENRCVGKCVCISHDTYQFSMKLVFTLKYVCDLHDIHIYMDLTYFNGSYRRLST